MILLIVGGCSKESKLESYYQIIDSADRIRILKQVDSDWRLQREVMGEELISLKEILKSNIKPTDQYPLKADIKFEIISSDKLIGQLLIGQPSINFISDEVNFGFRSTYRIGMYSSN
jgi:hypothetical protein